MDPQAVVNERAAPKEKTVTKCKMAIIAGDREAFIETQQSNHIVVK